MKQWAAKAWFFSSACWLVIGFGIEPLMADNRGSGLDQELSGEVLAGEEVVYTFDALPAGQRVFFQVTATNNENRLNWILEDSVGRVVVQNLSSLSDMGPVTLMGGDYRLTIRGETPSAAGTFSFIAHSVIDNTNAIALEAPVSRSLGSVGATDRLELTLAQAETVRLFFSGISASNVSYRVIDHLGNTRVSWTNSGPAVTEPLALSSGTHAIEVRGRGGFAGAFDLLVRALSESAPTPLPLGGTATYSSSDVTEVSVFQFALSDSKRIYPQFSFTHGSSSAQWRLDRVDGAVVSDWSTNLNAPLEPFDLLAGTYELRVRSRSTVGVSGDVSLFDVVDTASPLLPDQPARADILTPGQTHRFNLSALPVGDYLLDLTASTNNLAFNWWIEDPLGRRVLARTSNVNDIESIRLTGGDYVLVVSGENAVTGFVEFSLVTRTEINAAINVGAVLTESIAVPGESRHYNFTAVANQQLAIERQASSNGSVLNYSLVDSVGREVIERTTSLPNVLESVLVGGDYRLTVLAEGGATATYTLALIDNGVSGFSPSGTALALGELAQGTLISGGTQDWLLNVPTTMAVIFEVIEGAGSLDWTLLDAAGQPLFEDNRLSLPGTDDRGPFMLAAGDYTIRVNQPGSSSVDYGFRASEAPLIEDTINPDEIITSGPNAAGFQNDYLFSVPADGRYYFESRSGSSALRWRVERLDGESVFGPSVLSGDSNSQGPFDLRTGDYRLVVTAVNSSTASFEFQIHTVLDFSDTVVLNSAPLALTGALDMPGQRRVYDLTVGASVEQLYFQVGDGNSRLRYSLIDSAGRALVGPTRLSVSGTDDQGPIAILPGDYQLIISSVLPTAGAFTLTVYPYPASPAEQTALDQVEVWTPAAPIDEQRFAFSLTAALTRVVFDPRVAVSDVFATLTHLETGWQPFSRVQLNTLDNADRGPYNLPPGDYELTLQNRGGSGAPSWQLAAVIDQDGGEIELGQVVAAELATPGSRLTYTVRPDEPGQALLFDLMAQADDNQWELIDPVGTAVFGPANASNFSTHDRGPIPLAIGDYTLTFFNRENNITDWLFRVADSSGTVSLPEGCAACSALDVIFTFDTSPSMNPVNQTMCDLTEELVQVLADDGIPIEARFWGISENGDATCLTSNVTAELGVTVPGSPPPFMLALDQCDGSTGGLQENWGPAAAVVAGLAPWDADAVRLLIPVADEGPYCGDPVNDFDIESVYFARDTAIQNEVVISPLLPSIASDPVRAMAGLMTIGTGGISTVADFGIEDILPVARSIAVSACGTAQTVAAPEFSDLSPLPGTLLPSNVPIVLSGRVVPVNRLRPVLEVEVNGQPSSVLDSSGSFFATIELQPGPNLITISALEACGPTVLEIELTGAGNADDPWVNYTEVTDLLQAEFSRSTFDAPNQRLLVDVAANNSGGALPGPILMVVGLDLDPAVRLLNADGLTPEGEPYVLVVEDGEVLPSGGRSALRELAFSNPELASIDFQPRWLLPANQSPHFTSVPFSRATVGRGWSYSATAEDADSDSVSYALLVGPPGMTLANGTLSWTPGGAGSFDIVLRASDGRGGVARQAFSLSVVDPGFNAPPIFTSAPVIQAPIGADYRYQATVTDPDGDSVVFALLSSPSGLAVDSATGLLSWDNAQPGQHNVIVQADDGQGGLASQNFTLFIGEPATVSPGPAFSSVPVSFAAVETLYRYRFQFNPPQDPPPTITLAQSPPGMSVDPVNGVIEWLPQASDLGPHLIELMATDSAGQQATQRFTLTVLDTTPNQAPYLTTSPRQSAVEAELWTYAAQAIDPEFGDLSYSLASAPAGMQVDPVSGLVEWTPAPGTPASVAVTLVVSDVEGLSAEQVFAIAVRDINASPVFTSTPPATIARGRTYNHLFIVEDADGDPPRFELVDGPDGMTLDQEAGWLSWPTDGAAAGSYAFTIEVRDDWGGSTSRQVNVNVIEDTEIPELNIFIARQPACATEAVQVCLQATDNVGIASRELIIDGDVQTLTANCASWVPGTPGNIPAAANVIDTSGLTANGSRLLQVADCNDEQKPVVTLFSPDIDGLLLRPTPLVVSIDDNSPAALTWTVAIRAGLDGQPEVLAEGTGPVSESEVAVIDPTVLPEGEYFVSILGSDGLQTGGIEFRINVGGGFKPGRLRSAIADVVMPLAGTPLTIGRSYDSLDAGVHGQADGDLAPGWRLYLSGSVQDSARETSNPESPLALMLAEPFNFGTRVVVTKPNGERVGFTFEPQQRGFPASFQFEVNFEPDDGVDDELRVVGGPDVVSNFGAGFADYVIPYNPTTYELETPEKVVYVIDEALGLIEVRDALSGTLTISDEGIQSSTGLSIDYIRDAQGRVTEIQVPPAAVGEEAGRILYGYGASGKLETVTDLGGGVTTIQYGNPDYPHHVTAVIDPRGDILTQQIYDDEGRLIAQCPADGNSATLDGCTTYNYDVVGGIQTSFDTRGAQTDFVYSESGLLQLQRDWTDAVNFLEQIWIFDDAGNAIEYIDRAGGQTVSTYDERGNLLTQTEPGGQVFTWTYGDCSRFWETATDSLGNTWRNEFNEDCQLRFSTDPLGDVTEYQYSDSGLRTAIIDPLGQSWGFGYNGLGLESGRADPTGAANSTTYDNRGNEVSITDRNGQMRQFVTDDDGLVLSETWVGQGEQLGFEYNEVGLVIDEDNSDQALAIDYFATGRVQRLERSSDTQPDWWVEFLYDGNGNVTQVSDFAGGVTQYDYDALDQLIAISQSGPGINDKRVEFELNPMGLVTMIRRFGDLDGNVPGPTTVVDYACPSCPFEVNHIEHLRPDGSTIHEMRFTRNANGLVTQIVDAEGTHDFFYDGRGWLVNATHPSVPGLNSGSYDWDGQGNWLSIPGKPGMASLSYADSNGGHRLLFDGEMAYQYDLRGAATERLDGGTGERLDLDRDALGRLIAATLLDSQSAVLSQASYGYTPSGVRTFAERDGVRRHFVYDGENVILVLDDAGQVVSRRLQDRAVDRPLAIDDGSEIRWLLADHVGSIRDVVSTDGQTIAHYAYTPFGEQVLGPAPTIDDSLRFAGREFDIPGGLGYFRARAYAPDIARFLSEDPLEPWHYRYAENNPLKYTDPSGRFAAVSYGLKACDSLSLVLSIVDNYNTGKFIEGILLAAADGIKGEPVDVEAILESIKKQFGPKALLPCGVTIDLT